MKPPPQVAVVVVSHNTRDLLLECLASIIESTSAMKSELVVIDNASSDGSYAAASSAYPQAVMVSNAINLGFGAACNQAIRASSAEFILLINSDARLNRDALDGLLALAQRNERCGAAGCQVIDASGNQTVSVRNFLTPFNHALEELGITRRVKPPYLQRTWVPTLDENCRDCSVDWIDGSCMLLRRAALQHVGLFDERFFMYSEDEDLCFRLKQQGWLICFTGAATVVHHGGASTSQNSLEMLKNFYLSQMMFLEKHRGRRSAVLYVWVCRATLLLKQLARSIKRSDKRNPHPISRLSALGKAYRDWRLKQKELIPDQELSKTRS